RQPRRARQPSWPPIVRAGSQRSKPRRPDRLVVSTGQTGRAGLRGLSLSSGPFQITPAVVGAAFHFTRASLGRAFCFSFQINPAATDTIAPICFPSTLMVARAATTQTTGALRMEQQVGLRSAWSSNHLKNFRTPRRACYLKDGVGKCDAAGDYLLHA